MIFLDLSALYWDSKYVVGSWSAASEVLNLLPWQPQLETPLLGASSTECFHGHLTGPVHQYIIDSD